MDSKSISVRLPEGAINDMDEIAKKRFIPMGTMLRGWIMERFETERKGLSE